MYIEIEEKTAERNNAHHVAGVNERLTAWVGVTTEKG